MISLLTDVPISFSYIRVGVNPGIVLRVTMITGWDQAKGLFRERILQEVPRQADESERYRSLVEESFEGIFIQKGLKIAFANHRLHEMLGYQKGELQDIDCWLVYQPDYQELSGEKHNTPLQEDNGFSHYEVKLLCKDGSLLDGEITVKAGIFEKEPGLQAWVRDITERKRIEEERDKLEAQILEAQKMQAIGTLAGGIAHYFNNLLMAIQGNASLMLLDTDTNDPGYTRLTNIERAVQSGAELSEKLLGFAKGGKYEVKPTNMNELMETSFKMPACTKDGIRIHSKYQKDIWSVEVDRRQIERALLNLLLNASQAMPGGGDLYVRSMNVTLDRNYVRPHQGRPGNYVKISIADTGIGIDEATQQRIFEPFFTTKGMSQGKGLGLASTYGIIKNHGGIINLYSKEGEGTTFNIYLPASNGNVKEKTRFSVDAATPHSRELFF